MFSSIVNMSSTLENEDLDNGPLVRMEDVQPRDRSCDVSSSDVKNEPLEAYVVDELDYENGCVVDDDDSNIGSMISIQSEEVVGCDEDSNDETILPDMINVDEDIKPKLLVQSQPESWPTLEILPGGVIKHAEKFDNAAFGNTNGTDSKEMMYACAKCSRSFKYLFCLVKHVRWHEKEAKKQTTPDLTKFMSLEDQLVYLKKERAEFERNYKKQKVEVLARIATAISNIENIEDII